jgi:hypothetical protein
MLFAYELNLLASAGDFSAASLVYTNRIMNGMRLSTLTALLVFLGITTLKAQADTKPASGATLIGWTTNGPAVYRTYGRVTQVVPGPAVVYRPFSESLPMELRREMMLFRAAANFVPVMQKENVFDHFLPASLNHVVWTNFTAHTNGRNTLIWRVRSHPDGWPARAPKVEWNPSSLLWGMKGFTALSPCWAMEGNSGQVPITALTRRHGYARGHDMGGDRVGTNYAGKKVWFVTAQNGVIEMTAEREIVRTAQASGRDYTIILFNADLPDTIEPMRVVSSAAVLAPHHSIYTIYPGAPCPVFATEQTGYVSAGIPGFTLDVNKGGDSGSPNMIPMPGELVFFNGRSTSAASPEMQADMDTLSRLSGLDPAKYQLQWVDLSAYPSY